jgi:hypothetical protein
MIRQRPSGSYLISLVAGAAMAGIFVKVGFIQDFKLLIV